MNSPQARQWAEGLAKRSSGAGDAAKQIAMTYRLCFHREPTAVELATGLDFLESGASLADYCQVMMSLNEFVYVN
jgi:hypothetical protein